MGKESRSPERVTYRRVMGPAAVLILGICVTVALFWEIRGAELEKFHNEFDNRASECARLIEHKLANHILAAETLTQLFYASDLVEPHEFKAFTLPLLTRMQGISAVAWAPVVTRAQRSGFEEHGWKDVRQASRITERNRDFAFVPAGSRERYYPICYMETVKSDLKDLTGFDLGSIPEVHAALKRAENIHAPAVCSRISLKRDKYVTLVTVPFHRRDAGSRDHHKATGVLEGFITVILEEDDLKGSLSEIVRSSRLEFILSDVFNQAGQETVVSNVSAPFADRSFRSILYPKGLGIFRDIGFADSIWRLRIFAGREFMDLQYPFAYWLFLPSGVILTLLLGLYLFSVLTHRDRLEYLVAERTAELRSSEQKYRLLAENAHDVISVIDLDLNYVYVSPSVTRLRGYSVEEVMRQNPEEVMTPESRSRAMELLRRKILGNPSTKTDRVEPQTLELELYRKDGSTVWAEVMFSPVYDQEGTVQGIMGISRDISERKFSENALRESEEKYRQLVENANEAIFVSQDRVLRFVNSKTTDIFGYSREELLGQMFVPYIHPEDRDMVMDRHMRRLAGEDVPAVYTFRILDREGQTLWVEINAIAIQWEGRPATLNFLTDVSERIHAEEQKMMLERRLSQAQKMESIGTLAGGIAHDFNNILSSVLGYTGLAKMKQEKGEILGDELDQIMKAGIRARDLVKQILTFSRQTEIHKDAVSVTPIIKETIKLLRASLPSTIEIRQSLSADSATVMADPIQIHQIIMNLFTNAAYAMKDKGGILNVETKEVDLDEEYTSHCQDLEPCRYLRISISDSGIGIPDTIVNKIFDPFFTTKQRGEGTGMGLSVVHGIVKDMKGTISVYSEPGIGTAFHILLPLTGNENPFGSSEKTDMKRGSARILLVDDEEGILRSGQGILERLGYSVDATTTPAEALELFSRDPDAYDLVITDMTMPKMTGLELAETIHVIRPGVAVVLCTGFGFGIMDERIRKAGIKDVVMKPMIPGELAGVVHHVLNNR